MPTDGEAHAQAIADPHDTTRDDGAARETRMAARNTLELGASLLSTWGIALAMRFWLPRRLGPGLFGALSFADAFAATFFVALGLGLDPYVRKEIALRPTHASDFFGGTLAARALLWAILAPIMGVVLAAMHTAPELRRAVQVFALAQFFVATNATLSAFLQAKGNVGAMSALAVATKIVWALGAAFAVLANVGLSGVALAYLVSELIEALVLFHLASRHLGLALRIDLRATRDVLLRSLPNFVNALATTAYLKLDMTLLTLTGDAREAGWYAAAAAIAGVALLLAPLLGWVLLPTLARAAARSRVELFARIRSANEIVLVIAVPAALFLGLGSELAVRTLFGAAFAPAAAALRILAPTFIVTYVAMVLATTLLMLERPWTLAGVAVFGLIVNVTLNLLLIRPSLARLGPGGGGVGCALAMMGTELFVTSLMASLVGARAFDRRVAVTLGKCLAISALVLGTHRLTGRLGWAQLGLDLVLYIALALGARILRPTWTALVFDTLRRRRAAAPRTDG
jgi:O-antigen/teichoic acid export membrane protein